MKKVLSQIIKYLPLILLVVLILAPHDAYAGFSDWILEKAAKMIGIDTTDNCVVPGDTHSCFFCSLFEIIYNSGASVARSAYNAFHTDLGELIVVFLGVSLALIILKNVATMGSQDPGALMNTIISKVFVCAIIYYIVTRDYYNVLNMTITPILADGLGFVQSNGSGCSYLGNLHGFASAAGALNGEAMPRSVGSLIICAIEDTESKIDLIFDYGRWGICRGMGPDRIFHIIPNPLPIIDGIILYIAGIIFMVGYPWIMADAVIQLGIALALFPFALAGYAFGGTKQYLSKLFNWVLNTMFVFIFMGIMLGCIVNFVRDIIETAVSVHSDPVMLFLNPVTGLAFFGINMMKIIFVLAIGWTYMPEIRDLAGHFAKGADIKAAEKVGDSVRKPIESAAEKVADYGVGVAGKVAASTAKSTHRRAKAAVRQSIKFSVSQFGKTDASGNKTIKIAGIRYTTMQNADGTTYLKREYTSITGRKHVMIADKYSTIKQEYDRSGKLIKNEVKFKHSFIKDHLIDKDGQMNVGAIQTLLSSNLAQDPAYREAIMSQIAVEACKKQGIQVGTYFSSRNVRFNPADPGKIYIEQIDHNGKKTLIDLNVDMTTGQYRVAYDQDIKRTHPIKKVRRDAKIKAFNKVLRGGRRKTLFGEYEMKTDATTGELYYTRRRKKWLLFGPTVEKDFYADRTVRHKASSAKTVAKRRNNAAKIARKLRSVAPDSSGRRVKKSLFHTYESYIDSSGQMVYSRKLRKGWNIKNYYRGTKLATKLAFRAPLALATTTLNLPLTVLRQTGRAINVPLRNFGRAGRKLFRRSTWTTRAGIAGLGKDVGFGVINTVASPLRAVGWTFRAAGIDFWHGGNMQKTLDSSTPMQTGNPVEYTASGKTVTDSASGAPVSLSLNDETTVKDIDGAKTTTDNTTGSTTAQPVVNGERTLKIFGTFGDIEITGQLDSNGNMVNEVTRYHFSELIQDGHDHFTYAHDGNQVVEESGAIAADLLATAGGAPNPKYLLFGFNELFGKTAVGGMSMQDVILHNVFVAGRRRRTNKLSTNLSSLLV